MVMFHTPFWYACTNQLSMCRQTPCTCLQTEFIVLLQKNVFAAWFVVCGLVIVATLRRSDVAHVELFYIYFQPLLPVLTMLWLWAINVRYFEWTGVRYDVCFSAKDQKYLLRSRQIFQASLRVLSTNKLHIVLVQLMLLKCVLLHQ